MLSPKVGPEHSRLQPMADISSSKRYEPTEEISQVCEIYFIMIMWDKQTQDKVQW